MTTAAKSPGGTEHLALLGGPKTVTAEAPIWPRFLPDDIEAGKRALEKAGEDSTYVSGWFGGEPIEAPETPLHTMEAIQACIDRALANQAVRSRKITARKSKLS